MPPIINTLDVPFCIYVAVIYYCILALVQEELTLFFLLMDCCVNRTKNITGMSLQDNYELFFGTGIFIRKTWYMLLIEWKECFWICLRNCLFFGLWVWVPNVSTLQGLFVHKNCKLWNTFGRDISIKKCHL